MTKLKLPGMQGQSGCHVSGSAETVKGIPEDRMAGFVKMNPNLVGSSCVQGGFHQGGSPEFFQGLEMGLGPFSIAPAASESISSVSDQLAFDALFSSDGSSGNGEILPVNVSRLDGVFELFLDTRIGGDEH